MMPSFCGVALALSFVALGFMLGLVIGRDMANDNWRHILLERNIAEWRIDPKTGEKTFTYILGDAPKAEEDK